MRRKQQQNNNHIVVVAAETTTSSLQNTTTSQDANSSINTTTIKTATTPKRLIVIINILGILNLFGMILMMTMNTTTTTKQQQLAAKKTFFSKTIKKNNNNSNGTVRETILRLKRLGITPPPAKLLPPWNSIESKYGRNSPIVLGLDQCKEFRRRHFHEKKNGKMYLAPVGLFNTGTNLFVELINLNCNNNNNNNTNNNNSLLLTSLFQPPWGKHTPHDLRYDHIIPRYQSISDNDSVLPVIIIRHPIDWLKSMCRRPYAVYWPFNGRYDPNFVCPSILNGNKIPQRILALYGAGNRTYETIIHLWNEWYRGWYNTLDNYKIIIRMEDLLYYPQQVITPLCRCISSPSEEANFRMVLESSKRNQTGHFNHTTTYIKEFIHHSYPIEWKTFTEQDRAAIRTVIDKELLHLFHYTLPKK